MAVYSGISLIFALNNILFVDCGLHNILVQEYEHKKYRLIVIDGLGGRRIGWRFYLYLKSKLFTKYKIKNTNKIRRFIYFNLGYGVKEENKKLHLYFLKGKEVIRWQIIRIFK